MAVLSQTDLIAQVDTLIADNDAGAVSPADVRTCLTNVIDTLFSNPTTPSTGSAFSSAFSAAFG